MIEPLPNCFSICCSAAASAFALLSSMRLPLKFERIMAQGLMMEQKLLMAVAWAAAPFAVPVGRQAGLGKRLWQTAVTCFPLRPAPRQHCVHIQ
jgi:hypothetical protein